MNKELRSFIREVIEEARKPKPFDMDHFRSLKKFDDMNEYLDFHAKVLGSGMARTAFDVGSDLVVKMVIDRKGIKQNQREATIGDCSKNAPVPRVIEVGPKFIWIIVEKVEDGLSPKTIGGALNRITNGSITSLTTLYEFLYTGTHEALPGDKKHASYEVKHGKLYKTNAWYRSLFDMFDKCELTLEELHSANWGLTTKNMLVVLDPSPNV